MRAVPTFNRRIEKCEMKCIPCPSRCRQTSPIDDGIDRRGMLKCMAWVGTGVVWGVAGGVATSRFFGQAAAPIAKPTFSFVQISDSHLGFAREPNKDVAATLKQTVARINAMPEPPAFVLHTGDITHLAKPDQFDTVAEILKEVKTTGRCSMFLASTISTWMATRSI